MDNVSTISVPEQGQLMEVRQRRYVVSEVDQVKGAVQLGWAIWQMVGDSRQAELTSLNLENSSESDEMSTGLPGGFLALLTQSSSLSWKADR